MASWVLSATVRLGVGRGPLSSKFDRDAGSYLAALQHGASLSDALDAGQAVIHNQDVLDAAIEMINEDGAIDMKQLAQRAGISRASLYRYYADRRQVEGEVAARALKQLVAEVAPVGDDPVDRCQAAAAFLIDHPGEAAAIVWMAAAVGVDVLAATAELVVGDGNYAPWIIGVAAMSRAANRGGEREQLSAMAAALAERR